MQTKRMGVAVLSVAMVFSPVVVVAQMDQGTQNMQPQAQTGPVQNGAQNAANQTGSMQDSGGTGMTPRQMKDKMFLHKAAEGGMAEVELGKLAAQKASADDVKAFGQKMVDDHTALNEDMKPFIDAMGVMVPKRLNKKDKMEYDRLSGMSGADFDNEYLMYMVKDHHADMRDFRSEAASTPDPALKEAVEKGEKVIHEHTMMVTKLAKEKGVVMPAHPPKAN